MFQTILGASGPIGRNLAQELRTYTHEIRLVSRTPKKENPADQVMAADLLDAHQTDLAVSGSEVVYLTAGLKYQTKVWQEQWPLVMKNVIDACSRHGAKLVFFDNIYMIGGDNVQHITETSPYSPTSKKGIVREQLDRMIMDAVEKGKLTAILARCADYYGPAERNSFMNELVYKNLAKGKSAQWFCSASKKHSFTFLADAAKGTALLGNTATANNDIWNLPTSDQALTGSEWIQLFAREMHCNDNVQVLPVWMLKMLGMVIPVLREMPEMAYQYDRDYVFDSTKFQHHFHIKITSPEEGVHKTVQDLRDKVQYD